MVVAVVVGVGVLGGADVVHLVGGTALHAAGLGLVAGELWRVSHLQVQCDMRASYGDPQDVVRVNGVAGATDVLLLTGRVDDDGVLRGACAVSPLPALRV